MGFPRKLGRKQCGVSPPESLRPGSDFLSWPPSSREQNLLAGRSLTHLHPLLSGLLRLAVALVTADPILFLGWVILTTVAAGIFQA